MIYHYNIHDVLTLTIIDNRLRITRQLFDIEGGYRAFQVSERQQDLPNLTVEIGSFDPDLKGCSRLDDEFFVKPNYFYLSRTSHKLKGYWQFDVSDLEEDQCKVRVNANWTGMPFVSGRVIDFFIHYMLTRYGSPILHASSIASGGNAFIFAGRGGGGKTTIALGAVERKRFNFLGDNFILCKQGKVFSFFSDLNMFGYNLHPSVWQGLPRWKRLRFILWLQVYRFTRGYIKIFTRVSPLQIFSDVLLDSAELSSFNVLFSGEEFSFSQTTRAKAIQHMVSNQKLEFFQFVRHVEQYGCVFPHSEFAQHWEIYEEALQKNLPKDIPYNLIVVPRRISSAIVNKILDFVDNRLDVEMIKGGS